MMNQIKSREKFVDQVADTIKNNHGKNDESFIFGISGKWGEGKTEFLNSLEKKLKSEFEIVKINPWKFATDKISFLRYFVINLPSSKTGLLKRIRAFINRENTKDKIYYDFSENIIHWGWFLFMSLVIIWMFVIKIGYPDFLGSSISSNFKWIFTILLLPIILPLVGKMVSSQKSSKSIETLDKFDKYLDDKLNNYDGKNILIFVDDLDRVSPKIARDVLDNLRTFFDKKKLSFVVTGDHTVLERFLGKELLPGSKESEQLDEGRRFLKKIFNVYWRLPLPIDSEISSFLDGLFKENKDVLDNIFKKKVRSKVIFKRHLNIYFDKNFRHIIRFLDSVLFTFNIIKNLNDKDIGDKSEISQYHIELSKNPLLVIRILMIQELCAPLFEEIIKDFEVLSNLEYAVDKQNSQEIKSILDNLLDQLTNTQRQFIEKFLFEKPRFYENTLLRVSDIRPFLYLAADAGFGDSRGPSADDFTNILTSEDPKQIRQVLLASGKIKLEDGVKKFINDFSLNDDINKKNTLVKAVINALLEILEYKNINNIFFENLISLDFSYLKQLQSLERIESYKMIWRWLNNFINNRKISEYKELFKFDNQEDFRNINFEKDKEEDYFSSLIITRWFVDYYGQDKSNALILFSSKLGHLDNDAVINEINEIKEQLLNELIVENDENLRNIRFDIVWQYSDSKTRQLLKDKLLKEILKLNSSIWNFVVSKIGELKEDWKIEDFETVIAEAVKNVSDFNSLVQVFNFAKNKIDKKLNLFWGTILENHFKLFVDNIGQVINDVSYSVLAPNNEDAEKIFNELLDRIKNFDDGNKINVLLFLNKQKWLWNKLYKIDKRRFSGFSKSENADIKSIVEQIKSSWEGE